MMIKSLKIKITKLIDDFPPEIVEFIFLDASKKEHTFIDKTVCFSGDFNLNLTQLPTESELNVEVLKEWTKSNGEKMALIKPLYHIESNIGQTEFEVLAAQLSAVENQTKG